MKCTCGPYPTIDLTMLHYSLSELRLDSDKNTVNSAKDEEKNKVMKLVVDACQSYGCFHLVIKKNPQRDDLNDKLNVFRSKDGKSTTESVELMFQEDFLKHCFQKKSPSNYVNNSNVDIGGMHIMHFQGSEIDSSVSKCGIKEVTFRGRTAESGDPGSGESAPLAEPKQSWEFKRCQAQKQNNKDGAKTSTLSTLSILKEWTDALHSITVILSEALNLPSYVINKRECDCCDKSKEKYCNIDLLRVFRYDPLSSETQRLQNLGSSPHTDWGSMTIVWQDTVGGLQTFCPLHNSWNDVPPPPIANTKNTLDEEHPIHFFVHVGDFLSLATSSQWPSPRHRVICPAVDATSSSRCSLVYFAYPELGITLAEAKEALDAKNITLDEISKNGCVSAEKKKINENDESIETKDSCQNKFEEQGLPLSHYSVLQNQSLQPDTKCDSNVASLMTPELQTYQRIRNVHFDEVILEKWNQVQRG